MHEVVPLYIYTDRTSRIISLRSFFWLSTYFSKQKNAYVIVEDTIGAVDISKHRTDKITAMR